VHVAGDLEGCFAQRCRGADSRARPRDGCALGSDLRAGVDGPGFNSQATPSSRPPSPASAGVTDENASAAATKVPFTIDMAFSCSKLH